MRLTLGVRVPVTSVCPCSKAISDYGAHNQRAHITIRACPEFGEDGQPAAVWAEDLIDIAEAAASCPVYPLLKRPDERHVTMRAYDHPVFVEDMARAAAEALRGARADRIVQRRGRQRGEHPQPQRVCPDRVTAARGWARIGRGASDGRRRPCRQSRNRACDRHLRQPQEPACPRPVPPGQRACGDTDERARDWICRLSDTSYSPLIAARDLYAGEHWMVARGLPDLAGGERIRLWACSAGYGLIPADALVRPMRRPLPEAIRIPCPAAPMALELGGMR